MNTTRSYLDWLLLFIFCTISSMVLADETEIYFADKSDEVTPNVLFLIDASGSMGQVVSTDTQSPQRTRMQILKDSFSQVMTAAPANVSVGLMHYSNHNLDSNGYWWSSLKGVNFPSTPIDEHVEPMIAAYKGDDNLPDPASGSTTVREFLASIVSSWNANGYTPIVDSLYEAARYFRGDTVGWGNDIPAQGWAAHPLTYDGKISCKTYASPNPTCVKEWGECGALVLEDTCQTKTYSECCDDPNDPTDGWVDLGEGRGYCVNNNFTCTSTVTKCQYQKCAEYQTVGDLTYKTPIEHKCQANYLVLMSDGKPEYPYYPSLGDKDGTKYYPPSVKDPEATEVNAATHTSQIKVSQKVQNYMGKTCEDKPLGYASGTCGKELTHWLAETDQNPDLEGNQFVNTYTVGFALADEPIGTQYLQSLVTKDGGFFSAENSEELAGAFSAILNSISKNALSFSAPTYSVDESTLISHSEDVYIPMFDVDNQPLWPGNLKKFKRKEYKQADGTVISKIVDKNNEPALTDDGEFKDTAYDLWGDAASGKEVATGGAASQLPLPASRQLFTDVSTSLALTAKTNWLHSDNELITIDKLYQDNDGDASHTNNSTTNCDPDAPDASSYTGCVTRRKQLLDFVRGLDADGQPRKHMGDMLNTKPLIVDYDTKQLIFVGTNEGYLHAIDTDSGVEQWAFMPSSLLVHSNTFYQNIVSTNHVYGIDGPLTLWNYDKNGDGEIKSSDGDKRILYFGLRRGGKAYYALDITKADEPAILWKKENLATVNDGVWDELGEAWSKPTLAKMRIGTKESSSLKDVLIFGAGYDAAKDQEVVADRASDALGSDVFIIDAVTGELVWSLQHDVYNDSSTANPIKHSIPSDIRILDMDRNGALDRLYFADTGGNIWRVDMDHDLRDTDDDMYDYGDAKVTQFAALGSDGNNGTDIRKFFYEPDVALLEHNGAVRMTIAIGSGYRTHPLNANINDRFYVLNEPNVYTEPPETFTTITNTSLVNRTTLSSTDNILTGNYKGWYYVLPNMGEKVLASALTFLNKVIFTTFAPVDESGSAGSGDPCDTPPNSARAYVLDLFSGHAVANLDRDEDTSSDETAADGKDEFIVAGVNEILSAAQVIFRTPTASDGTACKEGDCHQTVEIRVGNMAVPLMDDSNSNNSNTANGVNDVAEKTDLTEILPRIFWLDHDVSQ